MNLKKVILIIALSFAMEEIWTRLIMNYGFPSPPNFIARIIGADGENAYDALSIELFLLSLIIICIMYLTLKKVINKN